MPAGRARVMGEGWWCGRAGPNGRPVPHTPRGYSLNLSNMGDSHSSNIEDPRGGRSLWGRVSPAPGDPHDGSEVGLRHDPNGARREEGRGQILHMCMIEHELCHFNMWVCMEHALNVSLTYVAFMSTSVTLTASAVHRACKVPVGHLLGTPPSGSRRSNGAPTGLTTASACNRSMGSCLASA